MEPKTTIIGFIKSNVLWVITGILGFVLLELGGHANKGEVLFDVAGALLFFPSLVILGAKLATALYDHFLRDLLVQNELIRYKQLRDMEAITPDEYQIKADELKKKFL